MIASRLLAVVVAAFLVFGETCLAGPWPRKQGSAFTQLGFSTIGYNKIYDDRAEKTPVFADVRDNVVQAFGEFGVTDRLTLTASIPFKFLSVSPVQSAFAPVASRLTNSGLGDIDVTVRYNLFVDNGLAGSGGVRLGIPTGDSKNANGLILGDGEFNIAPVLLFGKSFHPHPAYIAADIAFNVRGSGFSNELLYNVELGYGFFESRLYFILLLSGKESTSSVPSKPAAASVFGLSTNNQEFTAIVPKLLYKASEHLGISISFATATHGRNIAGGFVFAGGVFHEF